MSMYQKQQKTKTNTQLFAQKQKVQQPILLNSVNFHDESKSSQEQNGN